MPFLTILTYLFAALACLAGLALLLSALWNVRVSGFVHGAWDGTLGSPHDASLRLEYGFPGFMRRHEWPGKADDGTAADAAPDTHATETRRPSPASRPAASASPQAAAPDTADAASASAGPAGPAAREQEASADSSVDSSTEPSAKTAARAEPDAHDHRPNERPDGASSATRDPNRWRKALFRLVTDGPAWTGLAHYLRRVLSLAGRLLHARVELTLAHPDPALLGRVAGSWYAFTGPTPLRNVRTDFRFCAPHPAVTLHARGGFSALEFAGFVMAAVLTFPWIRLARRLRRSWKHREPQGWRKRLYRMLQSV